MARPLFSVLPATTLISLLLRSGNGVLLIELSIVKYAFSVISVAFSVYGYLVSEAYLIQAIARYFVTAIFLFTSFVVIVYHLKMCPVYNLELKMLRICGFERFVPYLISGSRMGSGNSTASGDPSHAQGGNARFLATLILAVPLSFLFA